MNSTRRIGPFVLAEILGEGRGTILYRAVRPHGSRPPHEVCIRIARDPRDTITTDRIQTEYEILRAMDNPRIPKAYGHYAEEGALAMSYFTGASLADALQARSDGLVQMAVSTALDIVIEVAHGLRHGHSIVGPHGRRIVHGHLGPQRIRLTPKGDLAIVGFGAHTKGRHPAYTAPEVARGNEPTAQSDQWTLGAILLELILGERVYTNVTSPTDASCAGDVAPWVHRLAVQYPPLEKSVRTMLSPNPNERFQRSHDLLKSLLTAARQIGGTVNRRHLISHVVAHADKLTKVRPERDPLSPVAGAPAPTRHNPSEEATEPLSDTGAAELSDPMIGAKVDIDPVPLPLQQSDWFEEIPSPNDEPETPGVARDVAPPAPEPTAPFLASEVAGMALGSLMVMLGVTYVFWVL